MLFKHCKIMWLARAMRVLKVLGGFCSPVGMWAETNGGVQMKTVGSCCDFVTLWEGFMWQWREIHRTQDADTSDSLCRRQGAIGRFIGCQVPRRLRQSIRTLRQGSYRVLCYEC